MLAKPQITFLLSVDTEEEWDWEGPFPEEDFSVENLHALPEFQLFCEKIGIRPCYFVDYAAAIGMTQQHEFLARVNAFKCELGAHLHPWANPPFFDKPTEENSHVVNLPLSQFEAKLDELLAIFETKLNYSPKAFRTGRWGISTDIMNSLYLRGFEIDSSVYPFYKNEFFNCNGSPLIPYWPSDGSVLDVGIQRNILEVPVTVGFNRTPFKNAAKLHDIAESKILRKLKTAALLWHSKILRKIYFSPEVTTTDDMISLAENAIKNGHKCLHMYFHSSNLINNGTGFLDSDDAYTLICNRLNEVVSYLRQNYHVVFMTPSEYRIFLLNNQELIAS